MSACHERSSLSSGLSWLYAHLDGAAKEERQRLKLAFEASLPPMSDPRGVSLR